MNMLPDETTDKVKLCPRNKNPLTLEMNWWQKVMDIQAFLRNGPI